MRLLSAVSAALALLLCGACDNQPVAIRPAGLRQAQALWTSYHLTRYAYVFQTTGFFINIDRHPIRLVVLNDSVSSAQDLTTDSLLPLGSEFPTIDGLFVRAAAALAGGTLAGITFDSTFGFPSRMDLAGLPDASGSFLASQLQPLP